MDVREINRAGWNARVAEGDAWSLPVSPEQIAQARQGDWSVILTPLKPVPRDWFGEIAGKDVLGLASGGVYLARGALAVVREGGSDSAGRIAIARFFAENLATAAPGLSDTITTGADTVLNAAI